MRGRTHSCAQVALGLPAPSPFLHQPPSHHLTSPPPHRFAGPRGAAARAGGAGGEHERHAAGSAPGRRLPGTAWRAGADGTALRRAAGHAAQPCLLQSECLPELSFLLCHGTSESQDRSRQGQRPGRPPGAAGSICPRNEKRGCKHVKARVSVVRFSLLPRQGGRRRGGGGGRRRAAAAAGREAQARPRCRGCRRCRRPRDSVHERGGAKLSWHVKKSKRWVARGRIGAAGPPDGGQPPAPLGNGI